MNKNLWFRAWLKKEKRIAKIQDLYFNKTGVIGFQESSTNSDYDGFRYFKDFELMLGLKIYDEIIFIGDIVHIYGGEQMFGHYEFDKVIVIKELEDLVMLSNLDGGIEVIGNIYENKDLLGEEKEK